MKRFGKLLTGTAVLLAVSSSAFAAETAKVEAYAHPCMFSNQGQETLSTDSTYITGGKILKQDGLITVKNKDRVIVDSWVKNMMGLLKDNQANCDFNSKMPVLRSELAVILSEGFNLRDTSANKYSDVAADYWATKWINGALNAHVMIGYPDKTFRPDQPVTKAEVFATIAQLIDVATDKSLIIPDFKNKEIKYIPRWATAPTKEVVASQLLEDIPNPDRVNDDEYLSKEQVAYLIGELRQNWSGKNSIARDANASDSIKNYTGGSMNIKLEDRLSARQSNIGDKFTAKTTTDATIAGQCFKAGSLVKGEVVEVVRPGVDNAGYVKVKFTEIKDGAQCAEFPKNISQAQADVCKNPNIIARLLGCPLSGAARIVGVAGRTAGAGVNVAANGLEQLGDNLSNVVVDVASLKPVAGVKNIGNAFVTVGRGVYNLCELAVSGTYGVVYETLDELRYVVAPQYSNESSLNPGEEITILY